MVNGSIVAKYVDVYIHYVVVCLDNMVFHYNYNDSLDSSVGRVQDWRSRSPVVDSQSRQFHFMLFTLIWSPGLCFEVFD